MRSRNASRRSPCFGSLSIPAALMCASTGAGASAHSANSPTISLLRRVVVKSFLGLRIEGGEIEGHENVCLAVLDLEFQPTQRLERGDIDDCSASLQHAEKGD